MNSYSQGWTDGLEAAISKMKEIAISNLEHHNVWSSSYIIHKIEAEMILRLIEELRNLEVK